MTLRGPILVALGGLALVAGLVGRSGARAEGDPAARPAPGGPAVVLELFTSQGCSSCPPADRLLAKLGEEGTLDGRRLVPLAFHVDYWNYIGWRDPFSSELWSRRQQRYSRAFGLGTIYTPQLVINGRSELVGSDASKVRRAIARPEVAASTGRVALQVSEASPGRLRVAVAARLEPPLQVSLQAMVAVFETGLVTEVGRGENARKTLRNEYVVRSLTPAFTVEPGGGSGRREGLDLDLDPAWKRGNLGVAAFLQDPESMAIHGAAASRLR